MAAAAGSGAGLKHGDELDDSLSGIRWGDEGFVSIVGFGSLMSRNSSAMTFPDLRNFRTARLRGFRRQFAHVAPGFLERGIANTETKEMASLSIEPVEHESEIVVSLFEVPLTAEAVAAWIEREHEFRFTAVQTFSMDGTPEAHLAVACARFDEEEYKARRCPPAEFARRWEAFGVTKIWRDDVLPCRTYLRHCALAARNLSPEAHVSFLDATFLADRVTPIRAHLEADPAIMDELPPPEYATRYGG